MNNLKKLSDKELHNELKASAGKERQILAEIIAYIHEVDSRRLYRRFGFPSLFEYLTKEMKYSNASAQRRINAARLLSAAPEIKDDLECGSLNLTQLSVVAQGLKQKVKLDKQANLSESDLVLSDSGSAQVEAVNETLAPTMQTTPARTADLKKQLIQEIKGKSIAQAQMTVAKTLNIPMTRLDRKTVHSDGSVTLEVTLNKEQMGPTAKMIW